MASSQLMASSQSIWLHHSQYGFIIGSNASSYSVWLHCNQFGFITVNMVYHNHFGFITVNRASSQLIWLHNSQYDFTTINMTSCEYGFSWIWFLASLFVACTEQYLLLTVIYIFMCNKHIYPKSFFYCWLQIRIALCSQ